MTSRTRSLLLAAGLALSVAGAAVAGGPVPLRGSPLQGKTGLRLLVADSPPFVLDVDSGSVTRVQGLGGDAGFTVLAVSPSAAVVARWGRTAGQARQLYLVRNGRARAVPLGSARDAVADADGKGVWVTRVLRPAHCVLQRIGLDGRRTAPRAIDCALVIRPAGSLGLAVRRSLVLDPLTGRTVTSSRRPVLGAAGDRLLLTGLGPADAPDGSLALVDTSAGSERTVHIPSSIGSLSPDPVVDPRGRYLALEFGNPAWKQSAAQVLDVWVIDTATAKLTHLPGMPAFLRLKRTSMQWTHDGRLVLLGEADRGGFVAVWRPGQRTLPLRLLRLPERDGASDSFAPFR